MKCPVCISEDKKSRVYPVNNKEYLCWDERGNLCYSEPATRFECSNGHEVCLLSAFDDDAWKALEDLNRIQNMMFTRKKESRQFHKKICAALDAGESVTLWYTDEDGNIVHFGDDNE